MNNNVNQHLATSDVDTPPQRHLPPKSQLPKAVRNALPIGRPKKHSAKLKEEAMHRSAVLAMVRKRPLDKSRQIGVDALARTWIDDGILQVEPLLQESMWVQYRYMSPWDRNELFYRAYLAKCKEYYGPKHHESPVAGKLAWCSLGEINAINRARIEADRAGVPYDMYCNVVIDGHMRNDKWEQPPLPNQMYGKLDIPRLRRKLTKQEISKRLYAKDWDTRFLAINYAGDPIQEAALNLLREDVHAATNKHERLRRYLRDRHAITETRANDMFGTDMVTEALGKHLKAQPGEGQAGVYRPGCYGLRLEAPDSPCAKCPLAVPCGTYRDAVTEEMTKLAGSDDPRRDRVRELNAKRSQRYYEKLARKAGRQVTKRARPRTDGKKVGAHTSRLSKYQSTRVPDVPRVYATEQQAELDRMLDDL